MENTNFPNSFLTILHTSLALMFLYCGYKSTAKANHMRDTAQSEIIFCWS